MDLKDATLMILIESAAHPSVARIARAAYDELASGQEVDYRILDELVGEASGQAARAIRHKYGATAHEAIFAPILREIDLEQLYPAAPTASRIPRKRRSAHGQQMVTLLLPPTHGQLLSASCSSLVSSSVVASTVCFTTLAARVSALSTPASMVGSPTAMSPAWLALRCSAASWSYLRGSVPPPNHSGMTRMCGLSIRSTTCGPPLPRRSRPRRTGRSFRSCAGARWHFLRTGSGYCR